MDIRIDRLRLQVPGMHPDAARELGRLLAEHLAAALAAEPLAPEPLAAEPLAAAPPGPDTAQLARLRVSVPASAGRHPGGVRPADAVSAAATEVSRALRGAVTGRAQVAR